MGKRKVRDAGGGGGVGGIKNIVHVLGERWKQKNRATYIIKREAEEYR